MGLLSFPPIVLMVDDAPENLEALGNILQPIYQLRVATNGVRALALVRQSPQPDLILLDVSMPGMDGYEVCSRLKEDSDTRNIPVIFVTARDEPGDMARGLDMGAVDYIARPFLPPIVQARVRTQLALYQQSQALRESEKRYRQLFEDAGDAIYVYDLTGNLLSANQTMCEWLGYSRAELVALKPDDLEAPEQAGYFQERLAVLKAQGLLSFERTYVRKDGHTVLAEVTARLSEYDRQPVIISIARDITERRLIEAAEQEQRALAYEQARQVAVLEERQRLAREMHDAVSQTLFSASVLAEGLPLVWERDPERAKVGLTQLVRLTKGAQAELRTLLLELRPQALLKTDLGELMKQLVDGLAGRTSIVVHLTLEGRYPLPETVQLVFFRVAQEALNNIVKHARASQVEMRLNNAEGRSLTLHIRDDGRGFDLACLPPERLGLKIMRERAETIGAALAVESCPGEGATVRLHWEASQYDTGR